MDLKRLFRRAGGIITAIALLTSMMAMAGAATGATTGTVTGTIISGSESGYNNGTTCKLCNTSISTGLISAANTSTYATYPQYYSKSPKSYLASTKSRAYKSVDLYCVSIKVNGTYYPLCMSCLENELKRTVDSDDYANISGGSSSGGSSSGSDSGSSTTTKSFSCGVCATTFSVSIVKTTTQSYTEYFGIDTLSDLKTYNSTVVYIGTPLQFAVVNINNKASPICMSCLEEKIAEYKANLREGTVVDSSTGAAAVPVTVTRAAAIFNVTVPTTLPVSVSADGTVTTATDAAIINSSAGPVAVTKVELTGQNDWVFAAYNENVRDLLVDAKRFGLQMTIGGTSIATLGNGSSEVLSDTLNSKIAKGQKCSVTYDAVIPAQTAAISNTQIANVVFTVGWA